MKRTILAGIAMLTLAPVAANGASRAVVRAEAEDARYELAGGCYALRALALDKLVAAGDGGYTATAGGVAGAEPFRMQATDLGHYLFYGREPDFMTGAEHPVTGVSVSGAAAPSEAADWRVDVVDGAFRIDLPGLDKVLSVGADGALTLVPPADAGSGARFGFVPADGCSRYPEVELNAQGTPSIGTSPDAEVRGFIDLHLHMMAYEFLGGEARCGRPWHRFGVTHALVDCPDHYPNGEAAVLENILSNGTPVGTHDPVGWPTFKSWPAPRSLTHEQVYYKWMERAWRGGLRLFTNLLVDNAVLCEIYPLKHNSCNEMDGVRLQAKRIRELERYIDAQSGGPGKGWFRIVTDPFQARRVINQGKLAVVLGIETSKLFDCGVYLDTPECDNASIDASLDEVYDLGVRQMELLNKFDSALAGVAGDGGALGAVINHGNKYETGYYWKMQTCSDENGPDNHDNEQLTMPFGNERDALAGAVFQAFGTSGHLPFYQAAPHCNIVGLSDLGRHLLGRMVEKGMIFDPDHMSVKARNEALDVIEAANYSGIISSHSWSTPDAYPRIYKLGGLITPYAGSSPGFADEWAELRGLRDPRFYGGFGYGADMNGFGGQGNPRGAGVPNPVTYPFKSFDGAVTLDKQVSGERVYDLNVDGVAHYGLYPDWIEDLRKIKGDAIVEDMARGAEAYLQMWERASGVPQARCAGRSAALSARGLGRVRLGDRSASALRRAGQPSRRSRGTLRYCVTGGGEMKALVSGGRVGLVSSTAAAHRALGVGTGAPLSSLPRSARAFGAGLRVAPAGRGASFVFGVRGARVSFVAVASRKTAASPAALRRALRRAGVR